MNLYRQSIFFFGAVLPTLLVVLLLAAAMLVKDKMQSSLATKQSGYQSVKQSEIAAKALESQIARDRVHLARWESQLAEETSSSVATHLREIIASLPPKEIQQTSFERLNANGGFGTASAQKSSQLRIAFRGTFRTLQRAFLALETRMPQLQLNELRIDPAPTSPTLLNVQVNYTAWEK